jgi:hypothetical protein
MMILVSRQPFRPICPFGLAWVGANHVGPVGARLLRHRALGKTSVGLANKSGNLPICAICVMGREAILEPSRMIRSSLRVMKVVDARHEHVMNLIEPNRWLPRISGCGSLCPCDVPGDCL